MFINALLQNNHFFALTQGGLNLNICTNEICRGCPLVAGVGEHSSLGICRLRRKGGVKNVHKKSPGYRR
jgi:hypothetical protein